MHELLFLEKLAIFKHNSGKREKIINWGRQSRKTSTRVIE